MEGPKEKQVTNAAATSGGGGGAKLGIRRARGREEPTLADTGGGRYSRDTNDMEVPLEMLNWLGAGGEGGDFGTRAGQVNKRRKSGRTGGNTGSNKGRKGARIRQKGG